MVQWLKRKRCFLLKNLSFQTSKLLMFGRISWKKTKEKYTATVNKKFILKVYFKVYSKLNFYRYFSLRDCLSLCNHFMLVYCFKCPPLVFALTSVERKVPVTAQKMKFSIKDFFSKCDQIRLFCAVRIPSSSRRFTVLAVTVTSHFPYGSAQRKWKIVFANFLVFFNGRCPTIFPSFLTVTTNLSTGLFDSISPCTCSCKRGVYTFFLNVVSFNIGNNFNICRNEIWDIFS